MRGSRAHIAGIGVSGSSPTELRAHAIAAATKALLDAGVRYTDVDQSIVCFDEKARIFPEWLSIFGTTGTAIAQVDNQSGLFTAAQFVRSGQRNCTLLIGTDGDVSVEESFVLKISTDEFEGISSGPHSCVRSLPHIACIPERCRNSYQCFQSSQYYPLKHIHSNEHLRSNYQGCA